MRYRYFYLFLFVLYLFWGDYINCMATNMVTVLTVNMITNMAANSARMIFCLEVTRQRPFGQFLTTFACYFDGAVFQQTIAVALVVGDVAILHDVLAFVLILF